MHIYHNTYNIELYRNYLQSSFHNATQSKINYDIYKAVILHANCRRNFQVIHTMHASELLLNLVSRGCHFLITAIYLEK